MTLKHHEATHYFANKIRKTYPTILLAIMTL
jgi:hypothetical protein